MNCMTDWRYLGVSSTGSICPPFSHISNFPNFSAVLRIVWTGSTISSLPWIRRVYIIVWILCTLFFQFVCLSLQEPKKCLNGTFAGKDHLLTCSFFKQDNFPFLSKVSFEKIILFFHGSSFSQHVSLQQLLGTEQSLLVFVSSRLFSFSKLVLHAKLMLLELILPPILELTKQFFEQ